MDAPVQLRHPHARTTSRPYSPRCGVVEAQETKSKAAGLPAVSSSLVHGLTKMGPVKTVKTLRMVNKKEGFDCPGCAWPDPDHRTTFEFCENGAKAVADEAMKAKVTLKFLGR